MRWRIASGEIELGGRTRLMGVVNVTPDSFSDGGLFLDPEAAVRHGLELAAQGADYLDVGGESTRPGSDPVPASTEIDRVVPVIKRLAAEVDVPISIDTRKAEVAAAALDAGASIVNDVSAGRDDPEMFEVVRESNAGFVLMHMLGDPMSMQQDPQYDDVVAEVQAFLAEGVEAAVAAGIERDALCVDPGIGFGKTLEHNLALLREIEAVRVEGVPQLVGPSRKAFIGRLTGADADDRVGGTAGAVAWLAAHGVEIVRVHDVREMRQVVQVVDAIHG
ncbi:MAG TPA: dihydropteroate synthase [Actinomycetota bacterium]|nr:dihydropteroate synthase [Actinomycetota bacterium]